MVGGTTPSGDDGCLKPSPSGPVGVGVEDVETVRVDRVLRAARDAAGLAAYHYFFQSPTPHARAAYLAAIEAEAEAELLSREVRATRSLE